MKKQKQKLALGFEASEKQRRPQDPGTGKSPALPMKQLGLSQIREAPYNPRISLKPGDPEFEKLKRSIETFGLVEPIIVNQRTKHIVGGHQRFHVLKDLGHKEFDAVIVDLSLDEEKALNVALNKISGHWDWDKLALLIQDFQKVNFDVTLTGFDLRESREVLTRYLDQQADGQYPQEKDASEALETITKPGDLIELGKHRLLCGDCGDPNHVRRLMNGEKAVLFSTDPPYLVGYDGTNRPAKNIMPGLKSKKHSGKNWSESYGKTWNENDPRCELYDKFIGAAVAEAITENAAWYHWHANKRQSYLEEMWNKHGAFVHQQIIWLKERPLLTHSWYAWEHEPCFFGWVAPHKPKRVTRENMTSVWKFPRILSGLPTGHPTPKPLELFEIPIRQHTVRGDICYEPFGGSGSQIIAAEKLGRRCYAMEISPVYCDLIVRRWMEFVGKNKVLKDLIRRYGRGK